MNAATTIASLALSAAPSLAQVEFRRPTVELSTAVASPGGGATGRIAASGRRFAIEYRIGFPTDRSRLRVFEYGASGWAELLGINWPQVGNPALFGVSFELDESTIFAGCPNAGRGEVYLVSRSSGGSQTWESRLLVAPPSADLGFGRIIKVDQDTLAVSAQRFVGEPFVNSGIVYVYRRSNGAWASEAVLTAPTDVQTHTNLRFGDRIALDGNSLAVTASTRALVQGLLEPRTGSVFVYERSGLGAWSLVQRIDCPDPQRSSDFGVGLSLSQDVLVAGRPGTAFSSRAGAAFIYERDALGQFQLAQQIAPSTGFVDQNGSDRFGISVDTEGGLVAAASDRSVNGEGEKKGAVFLFHRNSDGSWPAQESSAVGVPSHHGDGFASSFDLDEGRIFAPISFPSSPDYAAYVAGASTSADLCAPTGQGSGADVRIDVSEKSVILPESDLIYVSGASPGDLFLLFASLSGDTGSGTVIGGVGQTCLAGPVFLGLPRKVMGAPNGDVFSDAVMLPALRRMLRTQGSFVLQGLYRRTAPIGSTMLTNAVSVGL